MNKQIETLKEYWKDPVWSKVISAGIIFAIGALFTTLYTFFQSVYSKVAIKVTIKSILDIILIKLELPVWAFILLAFIFTIFTSKNIIEFVKVVIAKICKSNQLNQKDNLPIATEQSTVLFSNRMAKAFPGLRDLTWFNNPSKAIKRLEILLREPLSYRNGSKEFEVDPIWWFRGDSALDIEKFKIIGSNKVVMNINQLKIKRIAAYHSNIYYRNFIYVEAYGEKQTGLYNFTKDNINVNIESFGYSWEEYGLIKHFNFWKKPIRREDYDDGATVIGGKVVNAENAELRVRYLSDYNFIIAAKGSPYNSTKFEMDSKIYLDGILNGTVEFNEFFNFLKSFRKNEK